MREQLARVLSETLRGRGLTWSDRLVKQQPKVVVVVVVVVEVVVMVEVVLVVVFQW